MNLYKYDEFFLVVMNCVESSLITGKLYVCYSKILIDFHLLKETSIMMTTVACVIVWVICCAVKHVQLCFIWNVLILQWKMYLKKTGSVVFVKLIRYVVDILLLVQQMIMPI